MMKRYFLYDTVIQSEKAPSFALSVRALFDFLQLDVPCLKGAKADVGSEVMALNRLKFVEHNAHTLALASKEGGSIVCAESSAFISLQLTREALLNDASLREQVVSKLSKSGLELNFETEVLSLESFLAQEVGLEKLASLVKHPFSAFYVAHFLGTSFCQARKFTDMSMSEKLLDVVQAKKVSFASSYESDGFEVYTTSPLLAKQCASKTLLDMFDNAADIILVDDARSFIMFDFYQKECEKVAGRDINVSVLTLAQVLLLAFGVTDKAKLGLDKHKVPVTLI